jgi:hypothetical protein
VKQNVASEEIHSQSALHHSYCLSVGQTLTIQSVTLASHLSSTCSTWELVRNAELFPTAEQPPQPKVCILTRSPMSEVQFTTRLTCLFFFFEVGGAVLGFELRALCLLGRCATT